MAGMRTVIALASLCFVVAACGDNLTPGGTGDDDGTDAAETDASISDGRIDAPFDANCPARTGGQVGGPCTTDTQCNSAVGVNDGICLHAGQGGIGWPAAGYCITKYDACTMD